MKQKTLKILVGDTLQLQKAGDTTSERYASTVIGFVPGKSLLVTTPMVNDKSVLVREGQQFTVRMIQGSHIQGFVARIIHNAMAPYPHIHLSFPQEVEYIQVRNADRTDADIPVMTRNIKLPDQKDNWKSASIKDISASGARLESMGKIGEKNDTLLIKFKLQICSNEEEMELQTLIMNVDEPSDVNADEWGVYVFGAQFKDPGRLEQVLLHNYVMEQKMIHVI
ncbi:MAG: flagellar brake protein [Gammaproteobacteria bacterium]|nr:flagellar brake protein [Gammaproteobacteria bacterium]